MSKNNKNYGPNSDTPSGNTKKPEIYRENGKLNIKIEINRSLSMLELEEYIENFIKSAKIELIEAEEIQIKQQILLAYSNAVNK